jgi:hypothetical protein
LLQKGILVCTVAVNTASVAGTNFHFHFSPLRRVCFDDSVQQACSRRTTSARLSCHACTLLLDSNVPPLPPPPSPPNQAGEFNVLLAEAITSSKSASITQVVPPRYCSACRSLKTLQFYGDQQSLRSVSLLCLCSYVSLCFVLIQRLGNNAVTATTPHALVYQSWQYARYVSISVNNMRIHTIQRFTGVCVCANRRELLGNSPRHIPPSCPSSRYGSQCPNGGFAGP